jgi:hypothetical protein
MAGKLSGNEGANMSSLRPILLSCVLTVLAGRAGICAAPINLSPATKEDSLTRVAIQLEAGGHTLVRPSDSEADKQPANGKEAQADKKLPLSVVAQLSYDERRIADTTKASGAPLAIRYYDSADAVIKVDAGGRAPKLSDDFRYIVVGQSDVRPVLFSPEKSLSREDLDLIDVVGDPFSADRLLPTKPVSDGDSWANDATVMGSLLALDTVAVCEVQSVLEEFNAEHAKVRFAGTVHGTADGAATQQDVRGVYLVSRKLRRVTRLNLAVHETRAIGAATPGLDVVAKVQVTIAPITKSERIGADVVAKITQQDSSPTRDLTFEASTLGFRLRHDRAWYVTAEGREAITFRRVDSGDLVAQCTFTVLPSKSEGRQTALEQFEKDVTFNLGKSFCELVSSRQWQNAAGLYCYEVVVRGLVEELPVEWHYYLVAPQSGPRVSAVVTIEKPMIERLATADRDLVESLQLFPALPPVKTAAKPSSRSRK